MRLTTLLIFATITPCFADNSDAMLKSLAREGGTISNNDKDLLSQSIRSTKGSIARDMLETFYLDAADYQSQRRYSEALELYEKILSIDPQYKDAQGRRDRLVKIQTDSQQVSVRRSAQDLIRQGDASARKGLTVQAIAFWKQALERDPKNAEARKKIDETNKAMAQRQYEQGYIHYRHNELEDALDSWQNAVVFDPALKNKGLLMLMSKVELQLRQAQIARLNSQGVDQMQAGDLQGALKSYEELLSIQPRYDDARRARAKLRIQLGQAEMAAAQAAATDKKYQDAIEHYQASQEYGWEIVKAKAGVATMEAAIKKANQPVVVAKPKPAKPKVKAPPVETAAPVVAPPAVAVDAKAAKDHYRSGLAAIRSKDFQRAVQELEMAKDLDATDERIYMALERAKQEWRATAGGQ